MLKRYYALRSQYGFICSRDYSSLLIFDSKKARDEYIEKNDCWNGNTNNRVWKISSKDAYGMFTKVVDGVRDFTQGCYIVDSETLKVDRISVQTYRGTEWVDQKEAFEKYGLVFPSNDW